MVTLKSFTRSLEPITVFDDGGLSDVDAIDIMPSSELVSFRTPSRVRAYEDDVTNIVLNGFLGILCDQYTSLDGQNKNKLFQLISSELRKHVRIRPISNAAIQRQVRNSLSRLLQSGANLLSERNIRVTHGRDLAPFMTGQSIDPRSLVRFQQPLSSSSNRLLVQPSLSIVDCIHLCSKLADEFEDIKPLAEGRGAFGKVYMARRKSDDIVYAIKKIKIAADDRYANGMHREVESLSRLSHPNIVRYYDSWQGVEIEQQDSDADSEDESESSQYSSRPKANDGPTLRRYLYIHMELCETTLRCWLMDRVDQDYDKSYEIAKQILEGIMYVHSKNWFHRDLKPLNIFLSGDSPTTVPNIKIGDFGLARQTSSDSYESGASPQVNEFTAKVGTAMYGAPEQLNGSGYSMESDLFSVGLILYELFYLFKTDTEKMKSFDNLRKGKMDKEFESSRPVEAFIIRQLTARDPYSRPSAGEVLDMLGSRRGRDIANADIVSSMQSLSTELSELKIQLQDRDVELSKKDELLMQKDAQILALQERIAEFEALNLL